MAVSGTQGFQMDNTYTSVLMSDVAVSPGQDATFDRIWGGPMAKTTSLSADGQIGVAGPCIFYGYLVTTIVGAGVINIRDATAAGTGTIIEIVAAAAAVGTQELYPVGIYCATGCYADFASTGTLTFYYQQL
jgi:hypothetical protein